MKVCNTLKKKKKTKCFVWWGFLGAEGLSVFWWECILEGVGLGFWLGLCFLVRFGWGEGEERKRMGLYELFLWSTKVPCVGFEFTQTGLIWDCHKGHMVLEGAYGLEEGIHCSAAEPSHLVYLWGKLIVPWGRLHIYLGSHYKVLLFEPGCSAPIVIYLLELFSLKK